MNKIGFERVLVFALLIVTFVINGFLTEGQSINSTHDDAIVLDMPRGHDDWCRQYCHSNEQCTNMFKGDHLDLKVKARYSILDGPGEHLFTGKLFGNTISRQSFETQFVLDISFALDISPCKVYVTDFTAEEDSDGIAWDTDNVHISFRLFNTTIGHVKELTRQVQEIKSAIYEGRVSIYLSPSAAYISREIFASYSTISFFR